MNKNLSSLIGIAMLIFLLNSCVEEYWPELEENQDSSLVVDGMITNKAEPYTVKLSQAISFQDSIFKPKTGAMVRILDDEGNAEVLTEVLPGTYQTTNPDFIGIIGRRYKVQIVTSNAVEYESEYEELKAPTPIEAVTHEEENAIIDETTTSTVEGFQFYVSSELSENPQDFFYWELEETYEQHANFEIEAYYDGIPANSYATKPPTEFHKSLFDCWDTDTVPEFFTYSLAQSITPKVDKMPLHFIEFTDEKLKIGYSLLVRQYTIGESAHLFLKGLSDQNSDQNNFYTNQPYQLRGNISSVSNPEEQALGYFMAASMVESQRIFTKKYSSNTKPPYEFECGSALHNSISNPNLISSIIVNTQHSGSPYSLPLYFSTVAFLEWGGFAGDIPMIVYYFAFVETGCVDCRTKGGSNIKPDFWIDF